MNKIYVAKDSEVEAALKVLQDGLGDDHLAVDSETNGFDGRDNKLWSVQFGTRTDAILFPFYALNEKSKNLLRKFTEDKTIIAHNAKFDYKFLALNGFGIGGVYCTQEMEHILYAGKYFTFGLKDVLLRRFQIKMDKEPREDFYNGVFEQQVKQFGKFGIWEARPDLVDYALDDIVYLHEVFDDQQRDLKELGMEDLAWLENSLVPVVAETENRGVGLDIEATKKFESKVTIRRDELAHEIFTALGNSFAIRYQKEYTEKMKLWDAWKLSHEQIKAENSERDPNDKRRKTQEAKDAVAESNKNKPFNTEPPKSKPFNANSPTQLRMALSELTGLDIETTNKEWLVENISLHPAIETLVEFRKFEKLVQFCGIKDNLHMVTGRVHGRFNQNGTKSGRFSGADPNLQQIPARTEEAKEFRALFKPKKGYKFLGADLAGIELVINAYFSGETGLLEAINRGDDVHCYTMSILLETPYDILIKAKDGGELDFVERIKFDDMVGKFHNTFIMPELEPLQDDPIKWVKKFRDYVKTITYGLSYGLTRWGMSVKFHCSPDDAQKFTDLFFTAYPKLKEFIKQEEELGYNRSYAVNVLGRRRWFSVPKMKTYKQIEEETMKAFDKSGRLWDSITDDEWDITIALAVKQAKKEYQGKIGYIKRQSGNFFPQSTNADIIKLAMVKFNKEFNAVEGVDKTQEGIVLTVHDELIVEVRDDHVDVGARILKESMEYAVHKFMPEVAQDVQVEIADYWKK